MRTAASLRSTDLAKNLYLAVLVEKNEQIKQVLPRGPRDRNLPQLRRCGFLRGSCRPCARAPPGMPDNDLTSILHRNTTVTVKSDGHMCEGMRSLMLLASERPRLHVSVSGPASEDLCQCPSSETSPRGGRSRRAPPSASPSLHKEKSTFAKQFCEIVGVRDLKRGLSRARVCVCAVVSVCVCVCVFVCVVVCVCLCVYAEGRATKIKISSGQTGWEYTRRSLPNQDKWSVETLSQRPHHRRGQILPITVHLAGVWLAHRGKDGHARTSRYLPKLWLALGWMAFVLAILDSHAVRRRSLVWVVR